MIDLEHGILGFTVAFATARLETPEYQLSEQFKIKI